MHSPHLTHLLRNSFSAILPGGLITLGLRNSSFKKGFDLTRGTDNIPALIYVITLLLVRST